MTQDVDKIVQIKEAAKADLRKLPGVTGIGVGFKYVGGKQTDEIAIRVHVGEKKDVPPDQKIPETINGVKTDVVQSHFQLLSGADTTDNGRYNPLVGGIQIRSLAMGLEGTLGVMVVDNASVDKRLPEIMMLSNFHVMCVDWHWETRDKGIGQPTNELVGEVSRGYFGEVDYPPPPGNPSNPSLPRSLDCAVARITGRVYTNEIVEIGFVGGTTDRLDIVPEATIVYKRGRTSRRTKGRVWALATDAYNVEYPYMGTKTLENVFGIESLSGGPFAEPGDSGAVVVVYDSQGIAKAVGLLVALDKDNPLHAFACLINPVMDQLKVSLAIPVATDTLIGKIGNGGEGDLVWNWRSTANNVICVALSKSDGTHDFMPPQLLSPPVQQDWSKYQFLVGNITGNGTADLVWNWRSTANNVICVAFSKSDGTHDFMPPQLLSPPVQQDWSKYQFLVGDVTGKGRDDLVWTQVNEKTNSIWVGHFQDKDKPFDYRVTTITPLKQDWTGSQIFMGDITGKGRASLIANRLDKGNHIYVARSDGKGSFDFLDPQNLPEWGWSGYQAFMGHVNKNTKMADLVWTGRSGWPEGSPNAIFVALSQGDGTFHFLEKPTFLPNDIWGTYQVVVGDLTGDGYSDLVWVWSGNKKVIRVALGQGNNEFKLLEEQPFPFGEKFQYYTWRVMVGNKLTSDGSARLVFYDPSRQNTFTVGTFHKDTEKFTFLDPQSCDFKAKKA